MQLPFRLHSIWIKQAVLYVLTKRLLPSLCATLYLLFVSDIIESLLKVRLSWAEIHFFTFDRQLLTIKCTLIFVLIQKLNIGPNQFCRNIMDSDIYLKDEILKYSSTYVIHS